MIFRPSKLVGHVQINSDPLTAFMVTIYIEIPTSVSIYCYVRIYQTVRTRHNDFQTTGTTRGKQHVICGRCSVETVVVSTEPAVEHFIEMGRTWPIEQIQESIDSYN